MEFYERLTKLMNEKTVLTELIEEFQVLNEQLTAPYKNNDNIYFISTLHVRQSVGIETAIK